MRDGERKTSKPRQTPYEPFLSIQLFSLMGLQAEHRSMVVVWLAS